MDNIYTRNGYASREAYLADLADNHGLPLDRVLLAADLLGPNEDFDGLVTTLEDMGEFDEDY